MTQPADIFAAIDDYLIKSGKGDTYIAKKIIGLFESEESPLNLKKGVMLKLKENFKEFNKNIQKVNKETGKFADKLKLLDKTITDFTKALSIRPGLKVNIPNFAKISVVLEAMVKKMRLFRDNIRVNVLKTFFNNMKTFNGIFTKASNLLSRGFARGGRESATRSKPIEVHVADISPNLKKTFQSLFEKININQNTNINHNPQKDGSILGKIISGVIKTVALLGGIGFISKFLDETPAGRAIKTALGDMKDKAVEVFKPVLRKFASYVWEGIKMVFGEIPKFLFKQTFNFFGLKELLGEEGQGAAVLITKGLYYGIKKIITTTLNSLSFGGFKAVSDIIKSAITSPFTMLGKVISGWGDKLLTTFNEGLKTIGGIWKTISNPFKALFQSIKSIPTVLETMFKFSGGFSKTVGSLGKLFSGGIFKFLGGMLKNVAKRIPFIGAVLSFKDAYDRFTSGDIVGGLISVGSGIASFFPGIGTAISIGLDVLNAFLDTKNEDGSNMKSKINNFVKDIAVKIYDGFKTFIGSVMEFLNPLSWGRKIMDWFKGKKDTMENEIRGMDVEPDPTPKPSKHDVPVYAGARTRFIPVNDARSRGNQVIVPNDKDDIVMAKTGGPFDLAFKDMNKKLDALVTVFAEGVQLIAGTTAQGDMAIVKAVISSGGQKSGPSVISAGTNPITDFRLKAQRAIEAR